MTDKYATPKEAESAVMHLQARLRMLMELVEETKGSLEEAQIALDVLETENYLDEFDD